MTKFTSGHVYRGCGHRRTMHAQARLSGCHGNSFDRTVVAARTAAQMAAHLLTARPVVHEAQASRPSRLFAKGVQGAMATSHPKARAGTKPRSTHIHRQAYAPQWIQHLPHPKLHISTDHHVNCQREQELKLEDMVNMCNRRLPCGKQPH